MQPDNERPATYFAPPERAGADELAAMVEFVRHHPLFEALVESIDGYLMILNPERQVLAMNERMVEELNLGSVECLLGDRPGEVLGCIHAAEGPNGCGTSRTCSTCGAVIAILASRRQGQPVTEECLATIRRDGVLQALELRVRATPLEVGGHHFTILILNDISAFKRRQALERAFYHDILNTVGGLVGWSNLIGGIGEAPPDDAAGQILDLSLRLKEEMEAQRQLTMAERGELAPRLKVVEASEVLDGIERTFRKHPAADRRKLAIARPEGAEPLWTDEALLHRVIVNMVKNALEASETDATVTLRFERRDGRPIFLVHNEGTIDDAISMRIFHRSFTTKADGRGLGTFSMKLIGEEVLGGSVGFSSSPRAGTIFWIQLPAKKE